MPLLVQKWITREEIQANPDKIYVFGDNDARVGFGGQAKEMRGEPNTVGVRTKRAPTYRSVDFYYDKDFDENCLKIDQDMMKIRDYLKQGKIVVWPEAGVGTGIAKLSENAPNTLAAIENWLKILKLIPEPQDEDTDT